MKRAGGPPPGGGGPPCGQPLPAPLPPPPAPRSPPSPPDGGGCPPCPPFPDVSSISAARSTTTGTVGRPAGNFGDKAAPVVVCRHGAAARVDMGAAAGDPVRNAAGRPRPTDQPNESGRPPSAWRGPHTWGRPAMAVRPPTKALATVAGRVDPPDKKGPTWTPPPGAAATRPPPPAQGGPGGRSTHTRRLWPPGEASPIPPLSGRSNGHRVRPGRQPSWPAPAQGSRPAGPAQGCQPAAATPTAWPRRTTGCPHAGAATRRPPKHGHTGGRQEVTATAPTRPPRLNGGPHMAPARPPRDFLLARSSTLAPRGPYVPPRNRSLTAKAPPGCSRPRLFKRPSPR